MSLLARKPRGPGQFPRATLHVQSRPLHRNFANLVLSGPAGTRSTDSKNVFTLENHFHDSLNVGKHKGNPYRPAIARKLYAGRLCQAGVQARSPRTTGSPYPSRTSRGSTSLWNQFTTTCHPPRSFFQEVRTLIFQPGPSWGQERKRTPQFHQEGEAGWGWGGKRSERSQTDSLPPTPAPRSTGSDRAHRWRPGNSVPLSEQWPPEEEEEEEKGRTGLGTPRCWLGERRRTPKATTVTCGDRSLPPPPPPQRPSPRPPPKETS